MALTEDILEKHTIQIETLSERYWLMQTDIKLASKDNDYMKATLEEIKDKLQDVDLKLYKLKKDFSDFPKILLKIVKDHWKAIIPALCLLVFLMHEAGYYFFNWLLPYIKVKI